MKAHELFLIILLSADCSARAQASFQNLDFEDASVQATGLPTEVPFTNALPAWTGYLGSNQAAQATYNGISGAFAEISIIDRNSTFYSNSVVAGNYTTAISAGFSGTTFVPTAIAQTSLVPATAHSLIFDAQPFSGSINDLEITFNGHDVPFFQIGTGTNFQIYAADASPFAGQTGELRFIEQPSLSSSATTVLIDDIHFSMATIPEPGVFGLSTLGALLLCWRLRHRFDQQRLRQGLLPRKQAAGERSQRSPHRLHERRDNHSANLHQPNSHTVSGMACDQPDQASSVHHSIS